MNGKAYSYVRFSSPEQWEGRSYDRQREGIARYCAAHGLDLATDPEYSFFDAGRSAYKGEHIGEKGQLARFMGLVKDGSIGKGSTLIVESLDRLSRDDVYKALPWFIDLVQAGIRVVTLKDGRVWEPGKLRAEELILSVFVFSRANEESSTKAMRLADSFKDKREEARTKGKPMGNVAPMWLRLKEDRSGYEEILERVDVVRRIFDLTIAGHGKQKIARMLNAEGVPPFKRGVNGWGVSSVHHIVKNRAVLGEWQPYTRTGDTDDHAAESGELPPKRKRRQPIGKPIANYFPAILTEDVFVSARKAVDSRFKEKAGKQTPIFNVWQKVAKCIHCGSPMHIVNKGENKKRKTKGTTYMECSVGRKKVAGVCESSNGIRLDGSEQVFRLILARLDSMALVKDSGKKLVKQLSAVEGRIIQKKKTHADLRALLKHRPTTDLVDLVDEAPTELKGLEREKAHVLGELAAEDAIGFDTFMERLDLASYEGRNHANALMKRLEVLVFASRGAFMVSQKGRVLFGVGLENAGSANRWKAGRVGYLEPSAWNRQVQGEPLHSAAQKALKAAAPMHFVLPMQAGSLAFAIEEEADQARYDAIEDEGHAAEYP